jgi:catechol 2,3-dioxygenase-like lactoylglutathione lyase family enzyme
LTLITHVNTVTVYVDDQDSSLEFWTDKVGFVARKSEPMGPDARWIEVGPEDAQTCLVLYSKSMMENWEELRTSMVFDCDDIGET